MQPEKVTFCKFNRNQTKAIKAKIKPLTDQLKMSDEALQTYDCIIIDEAQFCKKSDIEFFYTHCRLP